MSEINSASPIFYVTIDRFFKHQISPFIVFSQRFSQIVEYKDWLGEYCIHKIILLWEYDILENLTLMKLHEIIIKNSLSYDSKRNIIFYPCCQKKLISKV